MKTIVVNVLVSCVGSFLALSVFIGIMYVIDKIQGDDEQETIQQSLEEKMIDYFESHDIPYEDVENGEYKFTYQDNVYFWQYDKEDEEFLHILSFWILPEISHNELTEVVNRMHKDYKFIKVTIESDTSVILTLEQIVGAGSDIDHIMTRGLSALELHARAIIEIAEKLQEE